MAVSERWCMFIDAKLVGGTVARSQKDDFPTTMAPTANPRRCPGALPPGVFELDWAKKGTIILAFSTSGVPPSKFLKAKGAKKMLAMAIGCCHQTAEYTRHWPRQIDTDRRRMRDMSGIRMLAAESRDPYAILGLQPTASALDIRKAFRARARLLHPDVSNDPRSSDQFRELVRAVESIQQGAAFQPSRGDPRLDPPSGLTPDALAEWLISHNNIILFMRGTKQRPLCDASELAVSMLSFTA